MDKQVKCVNTTGKSHEHITHLGGGPGSWAKMSLADVVRAIDAKTDTFYTSEGGKRAEVLVREVNGKKFVQTKADGEWKNNLLSLPAC
jgi:hypothetical protein